MDHYDIVFIGHLTTAIVISHEGHPVAEPGCLSLFGAMAASCLKKRIAVVTKIDKNEEQLLAPLKAAGVDLYLQPGQTSRYRIVHSKTSVDERQMFLERRGGYFCIEDLPPLEPCLVHLAGFGDKEEFPPEFMRALKERGFTLSIDIQSFIWQLDNQTQAITPQDIPDKEEILSLADFVKLDVSEAKVLTGADDIEEQAIILEKMGSNEILITSESGALVRSKGKTHFAGFTNKSLRGRTGRGDTFSGAYLTRRLDHSAEDSLRFAAALTSIKLETPGPFKESLENVLKRMMCDESSGPCFFQDPAG